MTKLTYYSLITLTTLGVGDMVPNGPVLRALTMLEAVVGVMYPTALVSRLVSLDVQHHKPPSL